MDFVSRNGLKENSTFISKSGVCENVWLQKILVAKDCKRYWSMMLLMLTNNILEPLVHPWNIASLSLFYRYHFGRCLSELTKLVALPYLCGWSTCSSNRLHDFLLPFLYVVRMSVYTVFSCMTRFIVGGRGPSLPPF